MSFVVFALIALLMLAVLALLHCNHRLTQACKLKDEMTEAARTAQRGHAESSEIARRAQADVDAWKRTAGERQGSIAELQSTVVMLRGDLQSARNGLHDQAAQIKDKDIRFAAQAREVELMKEDLERVHKARLAEALGRANKAEMERDAANKVLREREARYEEGWEQAVRLRDEADKLARLIKEHHAAKGHECCHLNDNKLYAAVGLGPADPQLPPLDEFIPACIRYWHEKQGVAMPCCPAGPQGEPGPCGEPETPPNGPATVSDGDFHRVLALLGGQDLKQSELAWLSLFGFGFAESGGQCIPGSGHEYYFRLVQVGTVLFDPLVSAMGLEEATGRWQEAVSAALAEGRHYRILEG